MIPKIDLEAVHARLTDFKANGKKIIGVFPHSLIPDELIYAANAIPLKLCLGGDEYATTKGTEYLTQATCPFARGCIGYFEQGKSIYKLIDIFIGGNFCNGDLCGSEIITKFFDIPFLKVTFPTTTAPFSFKFYIKECKLLKERLEEFTGTPITEEAIETSIQKYNQLRRALHNLNQGLKKNNSPLLGSDLQNLMHRFLLLGPDDTLTFIENLSLAGQESPKHRIPILLSGSGIALGDDLLTFVEEFDVKILVNDTWSGMHFYQNELHYNSDSSSDILESLANYYLLQCESSRMVPNTRRVPRVLKLVEEYEIKGVIDHVLKFCDPYVADMRRFKNALIDADIPILQLERDYATSLEQLKTRIGAFFEMIM